MISESCQIFVISVNFNLLRLQIYYARQYIVSAFDSSTDLALISICTSRLQDYSISSMFLFISMNHLCIYLVSMAENQVCWCKCRTRFHRFPSSRYRLINKTSLINAELCASLYFLRSPGESSDLKFHWANFTRMEKRRISDIFGVCNRSFHSNAWPPPCVTKSRSQPLKGQRKRGGVTA